MLCLKNVLISDEIDSQCVSLLEKNGLNVVKNTKLSKEELLQEIPKYDGLIVRSATKVTADVINAGTNLKIIGRAGTGVDNIDVEAATNRGVIVMNTPGGNTLSAAEHTCTLIIALTRDIARAAQSMKEGRWDRKKFMGVELYGKTLAIIGLGRIGREVALRMQSFGMRTIGFDPIIGADVAAEFDTQWLPLDDIWPQADFITVHTPLIPATTNLINDAVLNKCKPGIRVVNCARGGIIDEAALLRALESGQCAGAGLDVFIQEPPQDLSLVQHPNVIATPHLGASTKEAQTRVAVEIAQQFIDLTQGKKTVGAINASAFVSALSPASQPWIKLGESLGALAALFNSQTSSLKLQINGSELDSASSYMSSAFLSGYLRSGSNNNLNLINAPAVAKEKNMKVTTSKEPGPNNSVAVTLGSDALQLEGTIANGSPVLLSLQNYKFTVPAILTGPIVIFNAPPSSSLISSVSDQLAKEGGSIVGMSISNVMNNSVFGVLNLSSPLKNGLTCLKNVVSNAYVAVL